MKNIDVYFKKNIELGTITHHICCLESNIESKGFRNYLLSNNYKYKGSIHTEIINKYELDNLDKATTFVVNHLDNRNSFDFSDETLFFYNNDVDSQLLNATNEFARVLLQNSNRKETQNLLHAYLFNAHSENRNLEYLHEILIYLYTSNFDVKDWSFGDNSSLPIFTFVNSSKDKVFDLLYDYDNKKVIPCYFDSGDFEAKSIEEAIEKTSKEYIEMLK